MSPEQPHPQSLDGMSHEELVEYARERDYRARRATLAAGVLAASAKLRLRDPDFAFIWVTERGLVEFDEDGHPNPEQVEEALTQLLREKPYLAEPARVADVGATNPHAARSPRSITRDDLRRMSAEEINQARQDGRLDQLLLGE